MDIIIIIIYLYVCIIVVIIIAQRTVNDKRLSMRCIGNNMYYKNRKVTYYIRMCKRAICWTRIL